jgi:hypothetical protein
MEFEAIPGEPHRAGYTRKPIERAAKPIGVGRLTPHRIRVTWATLHAESGTDLQKIQSMLGHAEITTTMRYVEDSTAGLAEAQARLAKAMGLGVNSGAAKSEDSKGHQGTNRGTRAKKKNQSRKQAKQKQH